MLNLEKIGQKISLLRKRQSMNQNELAEKLFVTHQAVSKWENGRSLPSIELLHGLTQLFNVSIDYLLDDSDIQSDDYQTLLCNYPREVVIRRFLDGSNPKADIEKILYLLNPDERQMILDQIRLGNVDIPIEAFWHLLSREERMRILSNVNNHIWNIDLQDIRYQLTQEEQRFLKHRKIGGETIWVK